MNRGGGNNLNISGTRVVFQQPANTSGVVRIRSYVPLTNRPLGAAQVSQPAFNVVGSRPASIPPNNTRRLVGSGGDQQRQLLDAQRLQRQQQQEAAERYLTGPPNLDLVVLNRLSESFLWRQSFAASALRISATTLLDTMRVLINESNRFPPQVVNSESPEAIRAFFTQLTRGFRRVDLDILAFTRPNFQVYMTFRAGNTVLRFHFVPQGDVLDAFLVTLFGSTDMQQVQDFVQYTSTRVGVPQLSQIGEPANTSVLISIRVTGEDWTWTWNTAPHTAVLWPPYSPQSPSAFSQPPIAQTGATVGGSVVQSIATVSQQPPRRLLTGQRQLPNFRIVLNT